MKPEDTLETPGSIAILGAGPIGIEAALYGRYLGYQVTIFEAEEPCAKLKSVRMAPAPEHQSSPLGNAALAAQRAGRGGTTIEIDAKTIGEWLDNYWTPLLTTDLLAGRIRSGVSVSEIRLVPPEMEADEDAGSKDFDGELDTAGLYEEDDDIPDDFLIVWTDEDGKEKGERFEAILDARGENASWIGPGESVEQADALPPYLAWIGTRRQAKSDYLAGLVDIQEIYAILSGRPTLDVYKNLGG